MVLGHQGNTKLFDFRLGLRRESDHQEDDS